MNIDLTVAVTTHAEDFLLRPTLRSVANALEVFEAAGYTAELLLVLDRASEGTRREAIRWRDDVAMPFAVRTIEVQLGESGASRNAAANDARGVFLAFCDGDDLVSQDFFVTAYKLVASRSEPTIVHPETVVSFGDRTSSWTVRSGDDPAVSYRDLLTSNLWPSCALGRRDTFQRHPYPGLVPGGGFGPEDYAWNVVTSTAGVRHVTAPGTMFFYRTRISGGVNNAHSASVLPYFSIPALKAGFPKQESAVAHGAAAQRVRRKPQDVVLGLRPYLTRAGQLVPRPLRAPLRRPIVRLYAEILEALRTYPEPSPSALLAFKAAAELEPALSWTANSAARIEPWAPPVDQYAGVLEGIVSALADTEVLILAPWVGIGGADLVTANYAAALSSAAGLEGRVSILTTYLPERTLRASIPHGVRHYQLDPQFRGWPVERQQQLIAQLVALVRPKLILSINCFDFTTALRVYGRPICANSKVYLSLFAFDRIGSGDYPVNPITDDAQRQYLRDITGVITDNTVSESMISAILGVDEPFLQVHHQSAAVPAYDFDEVVKQTAAWYDHDFSSNAPFRVMWPHRLDKEKRPDSLLRIAQRVSAADLPMEIHVYGQRILHNGNDDLLPALAAAGVVYHGPYAGGLPALPTEDFHALLLTSESEGMPLVLAQALLLGLPVVASAVGGVVDLIANGETGLLTAGPDDIDGFVLALTKLMESRDLRRRLIRTGYTRAARQHGVEAFTLRTLKAFGYRRRPRQKTS